MYTKEFDAKVKAVGKADGLAEHQFEAIVSVFGNKDSVGDVVVRGAFADDLKAWEESGDPIPVIWSHSWADPFSHIGHVVKAEETDVGLKIVGEIDPDNPTAMQVYRLLKGRRVKQFSFAYDVLEAGWAKYENEDDEVFELRKLHIFEVGPTLVGANQETELLAVKAANLAKGAKAGRVLSQKNYDRLVAARDALNEVLASADPGEDDTKKTSTPSDVEKTTEPSQASSGRPAADDTSAAEDTVKGAPRRAALVARVATL